MDGKNFIFDVIRKKWLVLTPEEWVRQHMLQFLHVHRQYPLSLMSVERGTTYNKLQKRTDICIYGLDRTPILLVECKAPHVPITTTTVQQAAVYNQTLRAGLLLLTNGLEHFCWKVGEDGISLKPLKEVPAYSI